MMNPRRYSRPPLTEALIDLRVALREPVTLETLARMQLGEETAYPTRKNHVVVQGQISAGAPVAASATQTIMGYLFESTDGRQVFQARLDGFTFNRLAPYERWESFRDEARRLWSVYRNLIQISGVVRVAVRYINRLDLPLPMSDFREYLRTVPDVSPDLPQGLSGYLMRLEIPQDDIESTLVLNELLVPPASDGVVSIVLDIDLFRGFDAPVIDEQDIWGFLETLRTRKNQVFEACITDRTREAIA